MRTVADVVRSLPRVDMLPLEAPAYTGKGRTGSSLGFAVESMKHHTTDEGWQIFAGLQYVGYKLYGHNLLGTDVRHALIAEYPVAVVMQDKREWDVSQRDFRDSDARFTNVNALAKRSDVFKLTILKDAHQRPAYHADSASEMGVHAWITYYHTDIVKRLAPYVRKQHVIRTYHSVDSEHMLPYTDEGRTGTLFSGAISGAYPLRQRVAASLRQFKGVDYLPHPGYHRNGTATPAFLHTLARYKVALCTSSMYGYALRKLMEATAAGCVVVTDLPNDEVLPHIDGNMVRVDPGVPMSMLNSILQEACARYDGERQREFAAKARYFYDYRFTCAKLAEDIELLRSDYAYGA